MIYLVHGVYFFTLPDVAIGCGSGLNARDQPAKIDDQRDKFIMPGTRYAFCAAGKGYGTPRLTCLLFYFSRLAGQGIVPNVPTPTAPIAAPHELMLENVPAAVAASSALLASLASPFPGCGGGGGCGISSRSTSFRATKNAPGA